MVTILYVQPHIINVIFSSMQTTNVSIPQRSAVPTRSLRHWNDRPWIKTQTETHRDLFIVDKTSFWWVHQFKSKLLFCKNANLWFVTSVLFFFPSRTDGRFVIQTLFYNHFTQRFGIFPLLWKAAACSVYLTVVTFAVHPGAYRWPLQLWLTETSAALAPLVWNAASTSGPNVQVKAVTAKQ